MRKVVGVKRTRKACMNTYKQIHHCFTTVPLPQHRSFLTSPYVSIPLPQFHKNKHCDLYRRVCYEEGKSEAARSSMINAFPAVCNYSQYKMQCMETEKASTKIKRHMKDEIS